MSSLTSFGKVLRKFRIDKELTLKNLADNLNLSAAYLSAVETGRKQVNVQLIDNISKVMNLTTSETSTLIDAASENRPEVNIKPQSEFESKIALMFARRLGGNEERLNELHDILKEFELRD